jgi:hypothetical protein
MGNSFMQEETKRAVEMAVGLAGSVRLDAGLPNVDCGMEGGGSRELDWFLVVLGLVVGLRRGDC